MKRLKYYIVVASLFLVSCSNFLTYDKKGEPTSESFWKTEDDAIRAADGLYFFSGNDGVVGRGFMHYYNCSDDVVTGRAQAGCDAMKNFIPNFSRDVVNNWPEMYKLIKRANDIIKYVPDMDIQNSTKESVLGQAYFFRAWAYLWLAPYYGDNGINGGIPIVTEKTPIDSIDMPRTKSVTDNYDFCIADFKRAATLLPYLDELPTNEWGRPHKTACWAHIAKAALYYAQYDPAYYDMVIEYCDKIIETGKHDLVWDGFGEVFTMKNNWSKEYIWSFTSNELEGSILPGALLENKGWGLYNGWGYFTPTIELVEAFEPGDTRLAVTVLQPGDNMTYLGQEKIYYSTESTSGMMLNKYSEPFRYSDAIGNTINTSGDSPTTKLSIPLVRYAEVLLWKSEALIWQGKNGDEPLNIVRKRAGLQPKTNATKSDLKNERRCELAGEFTNRHLDLVRWGDAKEVYSTPLHGYSVRAKQAIVTSKDDLEISVKQVWASRNFNETVNHVFPIPTNEVSKGKNLKQNIGY